MAGPPKDVKRGRLFAQIVARGRIPNATVDFPRYDENGKAAGRVYLRPLTQRELDCARANAYAYVAEILAGKNESRWKPEELEDNATVAEILAVACRDPEDPDKPFFELGVIETRDCTSDEMSMLFASYNGIRERSYPTLSTMTEDEMWQWTRALEEGADDFPFSRISRAKLEAYCAWAARSLVTLARLWAGTTSNSSPASPSSDDTQP